MSAYPELDIRLRQLAREGGQVGIYTWDIIGPVEAYAEADRLPLSVTGVNRGSDGADLFLGGTGGHPLIALGRPGTDVLIGNYQADDLRGEDDDDLLYGWAGDDYLRRRARPAVPRRGGSRQAAGVGFSARRRGQRHARGLLRQ